MGHNTLTKNIFTPFNFIFFKEKGKISKQDKNDLIYLN
jgi:hypothetical protein